MECWTIEMLDNGANIVMQKLNMQKKTLTLRNTSSKKLCKIINNEINMKSL
jgi:hypothetical protein